jgi:hypothetical protein
MEFYWRVSINAWDTKDKVVFQIYFGYNLPYAKFDYGLCFEGYGESSSSCIAEEKTCINSMKLI